MKDPNFYMLAKTMHGLEEVLANELKDLGAQSIKIQKRAVSFKGDNGFMYKANLNLRTCLRILKPIKTFQAKDEKELYENILKMNWSRYLDVNKTFATHATTTSEVFSHSKYASLLVKDGIADFFRNKYGKRPNVNPKDPDISINLHVNKHTCTISLDSSGESLHKRGYKVNTIIAPMNEVLASGLILLSGWNKKDNFHDPMCGSGTILIEAAMIANNIPANIFRNNFGFEKWKDFDPELFEKIKDVSLNKEIEFKGSITGGDNFQKAVRICRKNIENALMFENIKVKNEDFFETKINENTFVIFNPPYGERIELGINEFYKKIGDSLKNNYKNCIAWLISSDIDNLKMIGLKPTKKIELMNGNLKCSFREFKIYEGSKKSKKLV